MTSINSLLQTAKELQILHAGPVPFNLFSVLRSSSDEVNLHSRFLATLLTPNAHALKDYPLRNLLETLGLGTFSMMNLRVQREAFGIDILVTNAERQAIVIENKIYAPDQPKQLQRYYDLMQCQGYHQVHVCYLTLDGREPSEGSLGDIPSKMQQAAASEQQINLSYNAFIKQWIQDCISQAIDDTALQESLKQYHALVSHLTGDDMSDAHLTALTNQLLESNTLLAAHDIRYAYDEALIKKQLEVWQGLEDAISTRLPELASKLSHDYLNPKNLAECCRFYVKGQRGSKNYGLCYKLAPHDIYISLEMEDTIYAGVYCERPRGKKYVRECLKKAEWQGRSHHDWLVYDYPREKIDFKAPTKAHLDSLVDPEKRAAFINDLVDIVASYWHMLTSEANKLGYVADGE